MFFFGSKEIPPPTIIDCLLFRDNCDIIDIINNSKLLMFVSVAVTLYLLFFFILLADLKYWWSLDKAQRQIIYYVDSVKRKLKSASAQKLRLNELHHDSDKFLKENNSQVKLLRTIRTFNNKGINSKQNYSAATVLGLNCEKEFWEPIDEYQ